MSVLRTFSDSQQMAAQNLINFYLSEELTASVGDVILSTMFALVLTHEKPFSDLTPLYFAILLNTMVSLSGANDKLKKLKHQIEEKFTTQVFAKIANFSKLQKERVVEFLGAFISQSCGRDLAKAENFLIKLTQGEISDDQKQMLKDVFNVICRFIFVKKAREQLD